MHFAVTGLDRSHWANAHPVSALFKEAFACVGLPYFNPHSFRNTLVQRAYELKLDAEQFKAWSQNLGHELCPFWETLDTADSRSPPASPARERMGGERPYRERPV